jgi:hypothetical protein
VFKRTNPFPDEESRRNYYGEAADKLIVGLAAARLYAKDKKRKADE